MKDAFQTNRRQILRILGIAGATTGVATLSAPVFANACQHDGTPLQFIPKNQPDHEPLENELEKYPRCPYCNMDRRKFHYSRHLIHYQDNRVDATCSLHCAALSLGLNIDRNPKAIYAADYGAMTDPKPLINAEEASYLIGSKQPGVMSTTSKLAFSDRSVAEKTKAAQGGELDNFDTALKAAYISMANDTLMIRKRRAERRQRAQQKPKQ